MSLYETLRHLADSYGLVMIFALYLILCGWHFLPRTRNGVEQAKHSIFEEDDNG
ncbi:CcoQ/FixQ family Cbb3-type cytochrome c oxidase assembly chaperone [Erythrobacter sp. YT30]|uniref:CcoQ/FixQ family Cbb3-type cytochrome c oxidase assembly chaperone n=1 Tax=Erythrobacter sp. YT30 TaxID=1735012 RepID=UPI00076D26F2|nr:CcoQ/FixQ family Cbb3-type cytochrome c oxidase assembly chaperone [Erythrobacter sp. YT30]KWV92055.1 cytochrome C oxidase Cbb3 [Erythrobacter sp. YT30]